MPIHSTNRLSTLLLAMIAIGAAATGIVSLSLYAGERADAPVPPAAADDDTPALPTITGRTAELLTDAQKQALAAPDSISLYVLTPERTAPPAEGPVVTAEHFYGYPIRGTGTVASAAHRSTLLTALYGAINHGGDPAACFNPRHGLRVVKGSFVVDFVICFECSGLHIHAGETDDQRRSVAARTTVGTAGDGVFNRVVAAMNLLAAEENNGDGDE